MNKSKLDILIEQEVTQLTKEQIEWLNEVVKGTWKYENGVVNVKGPVNITGNFITNAEANTTSMPVQFGKVNSDFYCSNLSLTTLKGCPSEVSGSFSCSFNRLTSLEYMPTKIGTVFYCRKNNFILNDKLFDDLAKIGKDKIGFYNDLIEELEDQIPIQFGITNKKVINKIWQSYMNILDGNK